jgi:hypothetical protein
LEKQEETQKPPGIIKKIKENVDDKEEQLVILSTFVRLGILVWSGAILTLTYVRLPAYLGIPEQSLDPTFIASVFTGVLSTFGVQPASKEKNGNGGGLTKEEVAKLLEASRKAQEKSKLE